MWLTATNYESHHGSHKTSSSLLINGYLTHISSVCFSCGLIGGSLSLSSIGRHTDHVASVPVFCCPSQVHSFSCGSSLQECLWLIRLSKQEGRLLLLLDALPLLRHPVYWLYLRAKRHCCCGSQVVGVLLEWLQLTICWISKHTNQKTQLFLIKLFNLLEKNKSKRFSLVFTVDKNRTGH